MNKYATICNYFSLQYDRFNVKYRKMLLGEKSFEIHENFVKD